MNPRITYAAAALLTVSAVYVGVWAGLFPQSFYDSFPGLNKVWVSVDGPYNEHLVRDVGGLYLGLAVAGALTLGCREQRSFVLLGAAWTAFSLLHLGYHVGHLDELATTGDKIAEIGSLGLTLVLALLLLVPGPKEGAR